MCVQCTTCCGALLSSGQKTYHSKGVPHSDEAPRNFHAPLSFLASFSFVSVFFSVFILAEFQVFSVSFLPPYSASLSLTVCHSIPDFQTKYVIMPLPTVLRFAHYVVGPVGELW